VNVMAITYEESRDRLHAPDARSKAYVEVCRAPPPRAAVGRFTNLISGLARRGLRDIYLPQNIDIEDIGGELAMRLAIWVCAAALASGCMTTASEAQTTAFSRNAKQREQAAHHAMRMVEASYQASMQAVTARVAGAAIARQNMATINIRR
jgi:hypothetical protein